MNKNEIENALIEWINSYAEADEKGIVSDLKELSDGVLMVSALNQFLKEPILIKEKKDRKMFAIENLEKIKLALKNVYKFFYHQPLNLDNMVSEIKNKNKNRIKEILIYILYASNYSKTNYHKKL